MLDDCGDLVKVEYQVQFAYIMEVFIQNLIKVLRCKNLLFFLVTLKHYLNKVMNGFKVEEVVVRDVNTNAEVEASVPRILTRTDLRLTNLPEVK